MNEQSAHIIQLQQERLRQAYKKVVIQLPSLKADQKFSMQTVLGMRFNLLLTGFNDTQTIRMLNMLNTSAEHMEHLYRTLNDLTETVGRVVAVTSEHLIKVEDSGSSTRSDSR
jgi:hypothetical protein